MDKNDAPISEWIQQLKLGESEAAERLWTHFANRLVSVARLRLQHAPKKAADEDDIALSVFDSICRGATAGRFEHVTNRDELWWLLVAVTRQKAVDYIRRETAWKRNGRGPTSSPAGLANPIEISLHEIASTDPSPEFMTMLNEQYSLLLERLRNDQLRRIAVLRIEGYTMPEIAATMSIGITTVERKLRLIRQNWAKELLPTDA